MGRSEGGSKLGRTPMGLRSGSRRYPAADCGVRRSRDGAGAHHLRGGIRPERPISGNTSQFPGLRRPDRRHRGALRAA
ncbi:hypothetical protein [Ornithinimicrobium kibberense]|uniref:hypothetical protein n=1 Tax=Ornithinimicrobium kibberense TaxID=282060 RepID=UPI00360D15A8